MFKISLDFNHRLISSIQLVLVSLQFDELEDEDVMSSLTIERVAYNYVKLVIESKTKPKP